jgi:hypothetical protein
MAIELNIFNAESLSMVNKDGIGGKWVEITVRDSQNEKHEIRIIPASSEANLAFFVGCKEAA